MSTITREFTKEQLQQIEAAAKEVMWPVVWSEKKAREHFSEKITPKVVLKLARIAQASLEAEAVYQVYGNNDDTWSDVDEEEMIRLSSDGEDTRTLYTAPPAPVSVPDEVSWEDVPEEITEDDMALASAWAHGFNQCRAAMLQGAEPVTTAYKLPDDFDFDRFNDVTWLEAVASNPHMHSPTTSTIAMVALELNRKLADGNAPVIPDWQTQAEKMAELYGSSFVLFRDGESPQCADPTKVIISFTDDGLGHGSAAPQQEAKNV